MAPVAPNLGDNRFAPLSPTPRAKRKKTINTTEEFPELPESTPTIKDDPKFILIKPTDPNKSLASYSVFAVHRSLLTISKEISKITQQADGSIVFLAKNRQVAKKFIDTKFLPGICEINSKLHDNLNCVKGTVYAPFLNNTPEDEIIEGLKDYNVTNIYKFQRLTDGVLKPTGVVLISFDRYLLPDKINIAWINTIVRPYYPNPMRCKVCQKLGHTQKHCKNLPSCGSCNLPPHTPDPCTRTYCANCSGEHAASSNTCPKYQQAREVLKIKIQEKCTMREANKIYKRRHPRQPNTLSFANAVKSSNTVKPTSSNTPLTRTNKFNNNNETNSFTETQTEIVDNNKHQNTNNQPQQNVTQKNRTENANGTHSAKHSRFLCDSHNNNAITTLSPTSSFIRDLNNSHIPITTAMETDTLEQQLSPTNSIKNKPTVTNSSKTIAPTTTSTVKDYPKTKTSQKKN